MQTHLDLIYEQLDTLVKLLLRESENLKHWVDEELSDWRQDDYFSLVYEIDSLTGSFAQVMDDLLPESPAAMVGINLSAALQNIREFSALMLDHHDFPPEQAAHLTLIHNTSADLVDIVHEITAK
jgi:hypothetical protein